MPLFLSVVLAGGIILGLILARYAGFQNHSNNVNHQKVNTLIEYVNNNYVESISEEELMEKSIEGLMEKLDPHSMYISADEFHAMVDPLLGSFEGIGVSFRMEKDTITVISPIPGGPSEQVGIQAGDRIVKVDGEDVASKNMDTREVMRRLKGPKGTTVDVTVYRRGHQELIDFTIIRDVIPTYSLDIAYMINDSIGYIRLNNFSATTAEEFHNALEELRESGMKGLILDLQGNTGGYLQAAVNVANELLRKGELIVYTEGEHHDKEMFYANGYGLFQEGKVVILMDEWSASASEIVAGAVQDNDRGQIVGRRSFGKGLVQEQLSFKDGSAVRLTVARYYTPTGRCIQKPYEIDDDDYHTDYFHRIMNGELEHADSIQVADSLKYTTPGGKTVYGGGGIIPDVFVPIQRDSTLRFYNQLINKGILYRYAFDFTDEHRSQLQDYTSFDNFNQNFTVTDAMMEEMIRFAQEQGIQPMQGDLKRSDQRTRTMIKAYIGRNILDNDGFFPLLNGIDPVFLKGAEVIQQR